MAALTPALSNCGQTGLTRENSLISDIPAVKLPLTFQLEQRNQEIAEIKKLHNASIYTEYTEEDTTLDDDNEKLSRIIYLDSITEDSAHMSENLFKLKVIFPDNRHKRQWNLVIFVLVIWTAFEIPLHASFHSLHHPAFFFSELIVLIFFAFDMYFQCKTSYMDKMEWVTDVNQIRLQYYKTWFAVDLIAIVPIAEIVRVIYGASTFASLLEWLHLLRVLKLVRAFSGLSNLSHTKAFGVILFTIILIAHWFACIFHELNDFEHGTDSWLYAQGLHNSSDLQTYVASLYFSITTLTSVGYGDIHAVNFLERLYVSFVVFISANIYSILLALMSLIISQLYHREAKYAAHRQECKTRTKSLLLNDDFQQRLITFNQYEKQAVEESSIQYLMQMNLPNSMKYKVLEKTIKPILLGIDNKFKKFKSPFDYCSDSVLLYIAERFEVCVGIPDDIIFKEGDFNYQKIYFVKKGTVKLVKQTTEDYKEMDVCRLKRASYFGEIPLLCRELCITSPFSAIAHSFVSLYTIRYSDFQELQLYAEEMYNIMKCIAKKRLIQTATFRDKLIIHQTCNDFEREKKFQKLETVNATNVKTSISAKFSNYTPKLSSIVTVSSTKHMSISNQL